MPPITIDTLFDTAVRIHLIEEHALSVSFVQNGILIRFPTTRRLAESLGIPHYYVLPLFGLMEEEELVTRAERVGILTTAKGTRKYLAHLTREYRPLAEALLGHALLSAIEEMAAVHAD